MKKISHVCLIDDDHIFVYGAKRVMRKMDFYEDLSVFSNGQEALDHLKNMAQNGDDLPSLIFLDLNMPIMNGWEFLEELGNTPGFELNGVSIFIMSSSVDPRDLERIQQYPVVKNYVLKPMTMNDLENVRLQLS
ncbi:MAG: response regulator [Eudoraea sp.]|nr:response regulator [Eudoraea sp.]NNJ40294.1 response regulator [Eudoraea sp.]